MAESYLQDVPGAVPYISPTDDRTTALMINALNERTKQYEAQLGAIAENEALLSQMKFRDPDRAGMLVRAAKIASDLDKEVQEKYGGDYAAIGARKAVASRLAREKGAFHTMQQKYEEEQPYRQLYAQLSASGQLAKKWNPTTGKIEEVTPFKQSLVDSEGNLLDTTIDYGDIKKKGDYVGYITENIVNPLNKQMRDLGLRYKSGPFAFTKTSIQGKQIGLNPEQAAATIDDAKAKRFLEENPTFAFEFGNDIQTAKNFIKDIVRQKAIQQTDYQYGNLTDQWGMMLAKKKLEKASTQTAVPPRSLLQSKGQNAFNLKDLGFDDVKHLMTKASGGDDNAKDILQTLKSRLPEAIRIGMEKIEKSRPQLWQKDFMNLPGFKRLSNQNKLEFVKDANELLGSSGFFRGANNVAVNSLMQKYGLEGRLTDTEKNVLRATTGNPLVGEAINKTRGFIDIATQGLTNPYYDIFKKKSEAFEKYTKRAKPYQQALNQVASEGVNYEVSGFSPQDYEKNKSVGNYLQSYGLQNFKPIGSEYNSRSYSRETGYWKKDELDDISKGITGVDFVGSGSKKGLTMNIRTKSGKVYPMSLDKSRVGDVEQFALGLALETQTPQIYVGAVANELDKQITYSKPIVGGNSFIKKMSRENATNKFGTEYYKMVKSGLIDPNEPYVYIVGDSKGNPVAISNQMDNIIDDFYKMEGQYSPTELFNYTLRQKLSSKKEVNRYLDTEE